MEVEELAMSDSTQACDIGLIGLGVMGKNLGLNLADHGYRVAAFDLDQLKIEAFEAQDAQERGGRPQRLFGCQSLVELLAKLAQPRIIFVSVPAGSAVDRVAENLLELGLDPNDIVVDTGNSLWTDSVAREAKFRGQFNFFGTAVSGGEMGARFGPSLMPSGDRQAWNRLEPVMQAIAAKVDPTTGLPIDSRIPGEPIQHGDPCVTYIGPAGSGHYVKMVHNGIEYADMQLICEAYHFLRNALQLTPSEIAQIFRQWNQGELNSYLIEISAEVLDQRDPETGQALVDVIVDKAGQKGTGLWTAVSSLELGTPAATIAQAVYARTLSSLKTQRITAAELFGQLNTRSIPSANHAEVINQLRDALYCSKICVYAQGFELMRVAATEQDWQLDFAGIAKIWRAGCIIRARFLQSISDAYQRSAAINNLLMDSFFSEQILAHQAAWRQAVVTGLQHAIPMPCMSSALSYFDSYRSATLPANLLQGQRDFFGAHTFERLDKQPGQKFHIEWSHSPRVIKPVN